jgi:hypothetical protein
MTSPQTPGPPAISAIDRRSTKALASGQYGRVELGQPRQRLNRVKRIAWVVALVVIVAACSSSHHLSTPRSTTTFTPAVKKAPTHAPKPGRSVSRPPTFRGPLTCPVRAALSVPHHQRDGTTRTLVPGQPIALLACRYHGLNQPQTIGTFARAATNLPVSQIAHDLNATPRPTSSVLPSCPIDYGETYMLYFSYQDGRPLLVRFDNGGCLYVTNGDLTLPFAPPRLTLRLEAALGRDHL